MRCAFVAAAAVVAMSIARAGAADPPPTKEACAAAFEAAQVLRKAGKLVEARTQLLVCVQDACPQIARVDCTRWLPEVEASIATVVFEAHDATGALVSDVRVTIDGALALTSLDGKAQSLDPGKHSLRFEHPPSPAVERDVIVLEGARNQRVVVTFEPVTPPPTASTSIPPPPPPAPTPTPSATQAPPAPPPAIPEPHGDTARTLGFVAAGVAAVGVASFAYFGATGVRDENHLRDTCAPSCARSDVDSVTTKYRIADISLAIGVVAAGLAAWLFVSSIPSTPARSGVGFAF